MLFFTPATIFWLILASSMAHVVEEYVGGWVKFVRSFDNPISQISTGVFYVVNLIFIFLCLLAALLNLSFFVFSLSIVALVFMNALIHLGGTIKFRRYTPGVATATLFYLPISLYAYYLYDEAGLLALTNVALSTLLGVGWMGLAVAFGIVTSRRARHGK